MLGEWWLFEWSSIREKVVALKSHPVPLKSGVRFIINTHLSWEESLQNQKNNFVFVTYTIIQSITSSEICALYLTHPSVHTTGAVGSQRCGGTPGGEHLGGRCLAQGSHLNRGQFLLESNPKPRITSPTLYPLGHDCSYDLTRWCRTSENICQSSETVWPLAESLPWTVNNASYFSGLFTTL